MSYDEQVATLAPVQMAADPVQMAGDKKSTVFPDASQLAKLLNTTVKEYHATVKAEMKRDFAVEMKKLKTTNPDFGYEKGSMNVAIKNPSTGESTVTDVPLSAYAR